ncbi:MAG: DEAD/DEAH box helicase family protein [Planctomycetes bacterium]|nr:DEAD/DEAH box helicase family protein [Planctomycetota bacterium]
MSWRDRIRARIHEDLSSEAILRCQNDAGFFIPEIGLSRPDRFSQFDIVGSVSHIETRELCLRTAKGSIASMTRCDATRLSMLLDAAAESVPLIEIGKIDYAKINLDLAANQGHKVSFDVIRPEPNYKIGATTTSRVGASCGPRIQPPDPPKEFEGMSLEDRLRVMLAPPIYESLRDPDLGLPFPPYPFQAYGIKWLLDRSSGLLADEMGLGKTMQAVLAARLLWRERKIEQVLIICPKSLISTWKAEIRKWWPSARDSTHEPAGDRRFFLRLATSGMVIKLINYEAIARESEWLAEQKWSHDLVIIDEAQRIKNAATDVARAVKALKGTRKWALTGTPLENRVRDVVSIFEFLDSKILSSEEPDHVRDRIRPYMLRRRTEEVIKDLPEKMTVK